MTIGRFNDCTISLRSKRVSRTQCEIISRNGQIFIRDEKSSNGTYLNTERIKGERRMEVNDLIGFGIKPLPRHRKYPENIFIFSLQKIKCDTIDLTKDDLTDETMERSLDIRAYCERSEVVSAIREHNYQLPYAENSTLKKKNSEDFTMENGEKSEFYSGEDFSTCKREDFKNDKIVNLRHFEEVDLSNVEFLRLKGFSVCLDNFKGKTVDGDENPLDVDENNDFNGENPDLRSENLVVNNQNNNNFELNSEKSLKIDSKIEKLSNLSSETQNSLDFNTEYESDVENTLNVDFNDENSLDVPKNLNDTLYVTSNFNNPLDVDPVSKKFSTNSCSNKDLLDVHSNDNNLLKKSITFTKLNKDLPKTFKNALENSDESLDVKKESLDVENPKIPSKIDENSHKTTSLDEKATVKNEKSIIILNGEKINENSFEKLENLSGLCEKDEDSVNSSNSLENNENLKEENSETLQKNEKILLEIKNCSENPLLLEHNLKGSLDVKEIHKYSLNVQENPKNSLGVEETSKNTQNNLENLTNPENIKENLQNDLIDDSNTEMFMEVDGTSTETSQNHLNGEKPEDRVDIFEPSLLELKETLQLKNNYISKETQNFEENREQIKIQEASNPPEPTQKPKTSPVIDRTKRLKLKENLQKSLKNGLQSLKEENLITFKAKYKQSLLNGDFLGKKPPKYINLKKPRKNQIVKNLLISEVMSLDSSGNLINPVDPAKDKELTISVVQSGINPDMIEKENPVNKEEIFHVNNNLEERSIENSLKAPLDVDNVEQTVEVTDGTTESEIVTEEVPLNSLDLEICPRKDDSLLANLPNFKNNSENKVNVEKSADNLEKSVNSIEKIAGNGISLKNLPKKIKVVLEITKSHNQNVINPVKIKIIPKSNGNLIKQQGIIINPKNTIKINKILLANPEVSEKASNTEILDKKALEVKENPSDVSKSDDSVAKFSVVDEITTEEEILQNPVESSEIIPEIIKINPKNDKNSQHDLEIPENSNKPTETPQITTNEGENQEIIESIDSNLNNSNLDIEITPIEPIITSKAPQASFKHLSKSLVYTKLTNRFKNFKKMTIRRSNRNSYAITENLLETNEIKVEKFNSLDESVITEIPFEESKSPSKKRKFDEIENPVESLKNVENKSKNSEAENKKNRKKLSKRMFKLIMMKNLQKAISPKKESRVVKNPFHQKPQVKKLPVLLKECFVSLERIDLEKCEKSIKIRNLRNFLSPVRNLRSNKRRTESCSSIDSLNIDLGTDPIEICLENLLVESGSEIDSVEDCMMDEESCNKIINLDKEENKVIVIDEELEKDEGIGSEIIAISESEEDNLTKNQNQVESKDSGLVLENYQDEETGLVELDLDSNTENPDLIESSALVKNPFLLNSLEDFSTKKFMESFESSETYTKVEKPIYPVKEKSSSIEILEIVHFPPNKDLISLNEEVNETFDEIVPSDPTTITENPLMIVIPDQINSLVKNEVQIPPKIIYISPKAKPINPIPVSEIQQIPASDNSQTSVIVQNPLSYDQPSTSKSLEISHKNPENLNASKKLGFENNENSEENRMNFFNSLRLRENVSKTDKKSDVDKIVKNFSKTPENYEKSCPIIEKPQNSNENLFNTPKISFETSEISFNTPENPASPQSDSEFKEEQRKLSAIQIRRQKMQEQILNYRKSLLTRKFRENSAKRDLDRYKSGPSESKILKSLLVSDKSSEYLKNRKKLKVGKKSEVNSETESEKIEGKLEDKTLLRELLMKSEGLGEDRKNENENEEILKNLLNSKHKAASKEKNHEKIIENDEKSPNAPKISSKVQNFGQISKNFDTDSLIIPNSPSNFGKNQSDEPKKSKFKKSDQNSSKFFKFSLKSSKFQNADQNLQKPQTLDEIHLKPSQNSPKIGNFHQNPFRVKNLGQNSTESQSLFQNFLQSPSSPKKPIETPFTVPDSPLFPLTLPQFSSPVLNASETDSIYPDNEKIMKMNVICSQNLELRSILKKDFGKKEKKKISFCNSVYVRTFVPDEFSENEGDEDEDY